VAIREENQAFVAENEETDGVIEIIGDDFFFNPAGFKGFVMNVDGQSAAVASVLAGSE
jgi:hypothetical protein